MAVRLLAMHGLAGAEGRGINITPLEVSGGPIINLIKVDEDSDALTALKARGFTSVPVVDYELEDGATGTFVGADAEVIERLGKEHRNV